MKSLGKGMGQGCRLPRRFRRYFFDQWKLDGEYPFMDDQDNPFSEGNYKVEEYFHQHDKNTMLRLLGDSELAKYKYIKQQREFFEREIAKLNEKIDSQLNENKPKHVQSMEREEQPKPQSYILDHPASRRVSLSSLLKPAYQF